jgi:hypothetical protein
MKCAKKGCPNDAENGSNYCAEHQKLMSKPVVYRTLKSRK